jgi:hypothetical protein
MIKYGHGIVGYVLTMISLIHGSITCIISVVMVSIIIYHKNHHQLKREQRTTLLLSGYIYFFICIYITMLISTNIQTLLGDEYGTDYNTSWCIFRGYFVDVFCCVIYHTFVVQVIYCDRFVRNFTEISSKTWNRVEILINDNNCYFIQIFRLSFVFVVLYIRTTDGFNHTGSLSLVHLFK